MYADANPLLFGDATGAQADFTASFDKFFSPASSAPPAKPVSPSNVMKSMKFDMINKTLARGANWSLDYQKIGGTQRVVYQSSQGVKVLGKTTEDTLRSVRTACGWLGSLSLSVQLNYMMWDFIGSHMRSLTDPNRPEAVQYRLRKSAEEEQKRAADEQQYQQLQALLAAEKAAKWQARLDPWKGTGISEQDLRNFLGALMGLYGTDTLRYKQEVEFWLKFARAKPQPKYQPQFQTTRDTAAKLLQFQRGLFGWW